MATYAPELLGQIRGGVDLAALVGRHVRLRKAGANWKGLCPFHSEKTPSFQVNPRLGIFKCFGCGVGGDAFGFLMRQDKLSFPEAVRALAAATGIALPEDRAERRDGPQRDELLRALGLAAKLYAEALGGTDGAAARAYLERRGIAPELVRRFGLGFAPEGWDTLLGLLARDGVTPAVLAAAGLAVPRQSGGGHYDRFRGRLMFPIRDVQGRVVAFGGRTLGNEQPKYLNSPETSLFSKGSVLFALDQASAPIRERNRALLVEGYVDCLMAHQHGFTETVAALGTAFTAGQLQILRRHCDEVVTFFDADTAGRRAAERAAELLEPGASGTTWALTRAGALDAPALRLRVALLPAGHDPDTFLRSEGPDAFAERVASARSLLAYALDRALDDPDGAGGPRARANAFARAALLLAKVGDAAEASALSREAAIRLGADPAQLWIEAQRLATSLRRPSAPAPAAGAATPAVERDLLALLLTSPDARQTLLPLVDPRDMSAPAHRALVAALAARPDADPASLFGDLSEDARHLLAELLVSSPPAADPGPGIAQFRRRLERQQGLRRVRALAEALARQDAAGSRDGSVDENLRQLDQETRSVYRVSRADAAAEPPAPEGAPSHE